MPAVLGRHASDDAGLYSVCPSFYREEFLQELLDNPPRTAPSSLATAGPVQDLCTTRDLERHGWQHRVPLEEVLHTRSDSDGARGHHDVDDDRSKNVTDAFSVKVATDIPTATVSK
jgi:hypothetical protein